MVAQIRSATGKLRMNEEAGISLRKLSHSSSLDLNINWEDVTCPICLDFPHNGVLLRCSSYDNGCRPFMCDTDHTHSNCLARFKSASGVPQATQTRPACPLCRGEVTGWIVVKEARAYLNTKKRCCQEKQCYYTGDFAELQRHAFSSHPHSRPSEIDPARRLNWENFQQSSDIIDVLSSIHAQVPHGVVLGDYVIEYGDDEDGGEYDDGFQGRGSKWWASCSSFYQVFGRLRCSGNRRRSRGHGLTESRARSNGWNGGSPSSVDSAVYRFRQGEDDVPGMAAAAADDDDYTVASRSAFDLHRYRISRGRPSR